MAMSAVHADVSSLPVESIANRANAALRTDGYITRLFVRERNAVRPVLVAQIERAEADGRLYGVDR